jgi:exonuclease SbcD
MAGEPSRVRVVHTSDWHLGRLLNGAHLTGDQACALDGLVELVRETRPDAVLVAGDVYDRSVPPPDAVALLDDTLTRLSETGSAVVIVAGNHDSPERLGFGSRLLARGGVHIAGPVTADVSSVSIASADGPARIWALPYADPAVVRSILGDESIRGHDEAVGAMLDRIRTSFVPGERNVLVCHEFVAGGVETADSERPLTVGGTAQIAVERFAGFDYVALGHLHRPQRVGDERVRYAGSLLKYSVSEADHVKSVAVVELGAGGPRVELAALPARRDVRRVTGTLAELVATAPGSGRDDYVYAMLTDLGPLYDPMASLRAVWPNCIGFERTAAALQPGSALPDVATVRSQGVAALFGSFFEHVTGETLSDEQFDEFVASADAGVAGEREG